MTLEQQVCAIEQAKRLKELGIDQVSLIYYLQCFVNNIESMQVVPKFNWEYGDYILNDSVSDALSGRCKNIVYSAFSVSELGAMLGLYLDRDPHAPNKSFDDWFETMEAKYGNNLSVCYNPLFIADYVIYLLENNYITAESCNKALQA